jgi:hypothetical protein
MNDKYKEQYEELKNIYINLKNNQMAVYKVPFILAFDFDNTIAKIMLSDIKSVNKNVISKPFLSNDFINYLKRLKQKYNAKFVIISFGYNDVIKHTLNMLDLLDLFDFIITPSYFNLSEGHDYYKELNGKNKMLKIISTKFKVSNHQILLLDDNKKNIDIAITKHYKVSHVIDRNGLIDKNIKDIQTFVENVL